MPLIEVISRRERRAISGCPDVMKTIKRSGVQSKSRLPRPQPELHQRPPRTRRDTGAVKWPSDGLRQTVAGPLFLCCETRSHVTTMKPCKREGIPLGEHKSSRQTGAVARSLPPSTPPPPRRVEGSFSKYPR